MLTMRRWHKQDSHKNGSTPSLTEAVKLAVGKPKKGWKRLQKAIKSQADMNERDAAGFTAMLYAARLNLPGVINELAEAGANVNLRSDDGNTAFHYACFREHWKVMSMLVRFGADPNAMDTNGRTPLIRAIECQDEELVTKLLELGASPEACGENDVTPLFAALSLVVPRNMNTCIVRRLLDAGSNVNALNRRGTSPLTFVCLQHQRSTELLELLLQRGATVNVRDAYGRTPLTHCLRTDISIGTDCLSLLLKSGADTNVIDGDGHTSLSIWALDLNTTLTYGHGTGRDHHRTLKQLLACGANPNIVTNLTNTNNLMQTVVRHSRYEEARALLAAGAEPIPLIDCAQDGQILQRSSLITALLNGNLHLAKLLSNGLFYTREETQFLSRLFHAENSIASEAAILKDKSRVTSITGRFIKSQSRSDLLDRYGSYCNSSMSSLHLDNNANVSTTTFFRRSPSVDTMLNCDFGSTYKLAQNKEMSSEMSLESLDNVNTPIVSAVIKRSYSKILELDTEASMLNVEPEQLVKLKQPKTREFIEDLCGKIPSLQKLCRRQVHHALRYDGDRAESVKQLPVCHNLQKYIIFELPEQHPYLMQYSNEIIYV